MVRMTGIKWEKTYQYRPVHNIVSSDFPKYQPTPWKFMDGKALMNLILSNEYQRMWVDEREAWRKKMYPENTTQNVDFVKRYVATFKNNYQPPKPTQKKLFKIKKFEEVPRKIETKRAPDDKAIRKPKEANK